jgi:predicted Zn-dependent protease
MKVEFKKSWGVALILLVTVGLAGCTVNPATGDQSFTGFMSLEDEIKIGRDEHPKILKSFSGAYKDLAVTTYVSGIGNRLAAKSELPNIKWTFTVLNSPQINAFALPGGYVYVTRGLMALASNEAELAGVIAHEIGHVTGRHTAQRYSSSILAGGLSMAAGIFLGSAAGDFANFAGHAALQSYSRGQEFEADSLGVRYLSRTNYDTRAMASFLSKLRSHSQLEAKRHKKDPSSVDQGDMFATHPRTIDRVERAIANAKGSKSGTRVGTIDYMERVHNLLYGDDPKEGFVKGRTFVHPEMRFRFDVPEGFRLFNGRTAVVAKGPGGSIIQFDMAGKPYNGAMTSYISNVWARRSSFNRVEPINVNGMQAATASTRIRQKNGTFDLRFIAIRQRNDRIYRFAFLTPPNLTDRLSLGLRQTTFSLKTILRAEAQKYHPNRIRVKPVRAGDGVRTFVRQMGVNDFKEETFRVINGLGNNERLRTGKLVKIISE